MIRSVGIDIGASSTVIVADDGELVRTDTGGISRASLVAFHGRTRLVGEEAVPQSASADSVSSLNLFFEQNTDEELKKSTLARHRNTRLGSDGAGRLQVDVMYNDELQTKPFTALLAMFLAKQAERIKVVYGDDVNLAFVLPPTATATSARTIRESCNIAGIDLARVCTVNKTDALLAAYSRKLNGLLDSEKEHLEGKKVVVIDMGATQTTAALISTNTLTDEKSKAPDAKGPEIIGAEHSDDLGAKHFDVSIFQTFADTVKQKHKEEPMAGTKRGYRLLNGCERIRKLLSGIPEANIQVESVSDMGDMAFTLRRDEMARMAEKPLSEFRALLQALCKNNGVTAADIAAVEVTGGGVRMQVVQAIVLELFGSSIGTTLGAKLDDGCVALGAALACNKAYVENASPVNTAPFLCLGMSAEALSAANGKGYSDEELIDLQKGEGKMQEQDKQITALLAQRNALEAYLLECRGYPHRKHGDTIPALKLEDTLNDYENWLWDCPDAGIEEVEGKFTALQADVKDLCKEFLAKKEEEEKQVEAELEASAAKAAAEKELNGEDDDHDNRKLKKADRMRLVMKNKEEGTEIFKGGVWRTAAARYHKALTHCSKFFDLTPADEEEVKGLKVTLYLNLASCYLKMESYEQAINNCTFAIDLDKRSAKAYYRRALARETKKEYEEALEDALNAQAENVVADKQINALVSKLKKILAAEKKKEKETWGKVLGGGGGGGGKKKGKK